MKIYRKFEFVLGLFGLGTMVLVYFYQKRPVTIYWLFLIFWTGKYFYESLTEPGSKQAGKRNRYYDKVAKQLHGRNYALKTNLQWILTLGFFFVGLVLRFVFELWLPIWIYVVFILLLSVSAFYAVGVQKSIPDYIDEHFPQGEEPEA